MNREQFLAALAIVTMLAGAAQQFYALKADVAELRIKFDFMHGSGWHPPAERR